VGGNQEYHAVLVNDGTTPEGFVRICGRPSTAPPFAMMEREITCREYLEFLNAAPGGPELVPGATGTVTRWTRDEGGFRIPPEWRGDWPVIGVSWNAATAYAAWRTTAAAQRGDPWRFALPTLDEYRLAAGDILFEYPFGRRFRPRWIKSCYARPRAQPEPVLRFPVDESPFGVFDLAGSVREWLDAWFDESRGLRFVAGGSWADAAPGEFRVFAADGAAPGDALSTTGFRLVVRDAP
jgi:formylglycine-generating enzyme required for sulfatase activity